MLKNDRSYPEFSIKFWAKVNRKSKDECWEWKASKSSDGCGQYYWKRAPRVAWELTHNKDIPNGLLCCHKCDNPGCVNPNHLFLGTYKNNYDDSAKKGRNLKSKETRKKMSKSHKNKIFSGVHKKNLSKAKRGENHHGVKLTEEIVIEIRRKRTIEKYSLKELSINYNVTQQTICDIAKNRSWKHI